MAEITWAWSIDIIRYYFVTTYIFTWFSALGAGIPKIETLKLKTDKLHFLHTLSVATVVAEQVVSALNFSPHDETLYKIMTAHRKSETYLSRSYRNQNKGGLRSDKTD